MIYKVFSDYEVCRQSFRVGVHRSNARTREHEYLRWEWVSVNPGTILTDDLTTFMDEQEVRAFLQSAMDQAWAIGIKPAGYKEEKPELEAVKYHLEDMRKLAFTVLNPPFLVKGTL